MIRRPLAAALAALLLPLPLAARAAAPVAQAVPAVAAPAAKRRLAFDLRAATYGGAFDGSYQRRQSGGVAVLEAGGKPHLAGEGWYLDVPVKLVHRQTFGTELSETQGSVEVEPWYVVSRKLRLGLVAGLSGKSRPDWPDLYQPTNAAGGGLLPTDRYGYLSWLAGPKLWAHPAPHQHVRASYRFADYDYKTDPSFNPDRFTGGDLMHLTPRDRTEHQVDLSWRYHQDTWRVGVSVDYTRRAYKTLLARNRRTGSTPNPGGLETNPKQELSIWEPAAELTLIRMGGKLEGSVGYGIEKRTDPYQGYYSLTAHVPRAKARLGIGEKLSVEAGIKGWYATYTADGSTRLDGAAGSRRLDTRTRLDGGAEYRLGGGLALRAQVMWRQRATNYRDYVPPPGGTSSYDIDWDYTNVLVLAGLQYRM